MSRWETGGPQPRFLQIEYGGTYFKAADIKGIFSLIRGHKERIGERWLPGTEEEIWLVLKATYPKHVHQILDTREPNITLSSVFSFIRFMVKQGFSNHLVKPEEAERRVAICRRCPKAQKVPACGVCKQGLGLMVTPPYALQVPEGCAACGCYLPLKAWVPRAHLGPAADFPYWTECWMQEASPPGSSDS